MRALRVFLFIGLVTFSTLLGGCGRATGNPMLSTLLAGDWASPCVAMGTDYHQAIISFQQNGQLVLTEKISTKSNCESDTIAVMAGTYKEGTAGQDGAVPLNGNLASNLEMKILDPISLEAANKQSFLGYHDWELGKAKDVTKIVDPNALIISGIAHGMQNTVYRTEGNAVYFGANLQTRQQSFQRVSYALTATN